MKKPADPRAPVPLRATLRQIAAAAGVSSMTVSRALGDRREIAAATRDRIREIARRFDYQPDPEVAKLMHHLRGRRRQRFQSIICGLTTRVSSDHETYFNALAAGAEAQARSRGYGFMIQRIDTAPARWSGVDRMLRSRGVEGLLLLPQRMPIDLGPLLDWSAYSAVSASPSATGPAVHRVTPNHFANTLLLCRTLAAQGCKRIGMVISAHHDVRSEHAFTAATMWHGLREAAHAVLPLVHTDTLAEPLLAWFAREKPDAIIASEISAARDYARLLQLKLGGPVRFAVTSLPPNDRSPLGGIDERPAAIGAAAIDVLAGLIERRTRGTPDLPTSTLLEGIWRA